MPDKAKRLRPADATLRQLYLRSGNLCAYPGCDTVLISKDGTMVGDICHISAAEKNGPRFDANMTNESRRTAPNLLLLCAVHHRKVDREVLTYDVEKLKRFKREHEARFSEIENTLTRRFDAQYADETDAIAPTAPATFRRFDAISGGHLDDDERVAIARRQLDRYIAKLKRLPDDDRKLMVALIRRAQKFDSQTFFGVSVSVHAEEFATVHKIGKNRVMRFADALERHSVGGAYERNAGVYEIGLEEPSEYIRWIDIVAFCEAEGVGLEQFAVHLKFDLLD